MVIRPKQKQKQKNPPHQKNKTKQKTQKLRKVGGNQKNTHLGGLVKVDLIQFAVPLEHSNRNAK